MNDWVSIDQTALSPSNGVKLGGAKPKQKLKFKVDLWPVKNSRKQNKIKYIHFYGTSCGRQCSIDVKPKKPHLTIVSYISSSIKHYHIWIIISLGMQFNSTMSLTSVLMQLLWLSDTQEMYIGPVSNPFQSHRKSNVLPWNFIFRVKFSNLCYKITIMWYSFNTQVPSSCWFVLINQYMCQGHIFKMHRSHKKIFICFSASCSKDKIAWLRLLLIVNIRNLQLKRNYHFVFRSRGNYKSTIINYNKK